MAPGRGLVVEGAGLEASVQDADEPVGESPQGVVVFDSSGAELVVEGSGAGGAADGAERPLVAGVGQEPVAYEAGGDRTFLA